MILLSFLALLGHGYLLMLSLNYTYAHTWHRKILKTQRQVWGLLLIGVPIAFGYFFDTDLLRLGTNALEKGEWIAPATYAWIAVLAGLTFLFVTIFRLFQRTPAVVLDERIQIVDVTKKLGHRPVGDGRFRRVAELSINQLFCVEFAEVQLHVPGLPAKWDGLRILHLSDLHFYGTPGQEYFEFVIKRAMDDGVPDLVVLSGDIIDDAKYLEWIEPVLAPLKWNVAALAILGNHDWWQDDRSIRERLASLGMRVISNKWEVIEVRGEGLIAIGHEGPWFRPPPDLSNCPAGFRLLVSHTPDNIGWARKHGCALMLAGHNHGGQIRLPIIGSMFVPSKFSRRFDMGTFHRPPTVLHVNRGLSGKEPIRFRCPPQISRLILRASPTSVVRSDNEGRDPG